MKNLIVPLVVNIVVVAVNIYTWLTLPFYYVFQMPWRRLKMAGNCGAHLVGRGKMPPNSVEDRVGFDYLEYERYANVPYHPMMDAKTVVEAFQMIPKLYPSDRNCLGYREILKEDVQLDANGKPIRIDGKVLRKYTLSDYKWLTYGETMQLIQDTGRGLKTIGLKKLERVAIYSETGTNVFISIAGCSYAGAEVVTLFHTLTNEGLVHALNQTEVSVMFTSFELIDRVSSFIDQCPTIKHIVYFEGSISIPLNIFADFFFAGFRSKGT